MIQKAFVNFLHGKTRILFTSNPAFLEIVDKVILIENGCIVK